jgi:hypothetical protein
MVEIIQRVAVFRENYLIRDYHRCVIIRKFDYIEVKECFKREGGDRAKNEVGIFIFLEVVYILSHSLMNIGSGKTELVYIYYV